MATSGETSLTDTEMAECDGVVTMMDVLKEQQDFEDDANAVLGGSDEKECTYSQGYIKRQAIYACLTCCPESKDDPSKRAGFCLACSLNCHENHDLVELYTKRNFRCDCGNPKFKSPCQFTPNKPELDDENVYNQNFIGLYCICNRPYGDQESTLDDEMIQCIICEDWWHSTHLDAVVPANDQYSEMICKLCMANNEFLHDYSDLAVNAESVDVNVNVVETDDKLTNGSLIDEKLVNGSVINEKLTNGIEEDLVTKLMDTSTTETENESILANINEKEASTTEQDRIEPEKSENKSVEPESPVEKSDENKLTDASMDSDETDKSADLINKVGSDDKPDTISIDQIESSIPSEDMAEKTENEEKIKESDETLIEKTFNDSAASTDKADVADETNVNAESTVTDPEDQSEADKKHNDSSTKPDLATPKVENVSDITERLSENLDTVENQAKYDQEAETDVEREKVTQVSSKIGSPSAETDEPTELTNVETNDNMSDEAKAAETSQDEEMSDISKETDPKIVSEDDPPINNSKVEEAVNGDSKESDSTNKNESESNDIIVPELSYTENKRKISPEDIPEDIISVKKPKLDNTKCLRPNGVRKVYNGATFWPSAFRQKLCTCNVCICMYKDLSVLFLTDLEDTVFAYETLGKERTAGKPNQYEKGMEALCSLGRIQQIDALTEYNKMKDKLLTFLQSFKDKKEIVTERDIKTFFAGMKPEKRTDGVYFCR